MLRVSLPAVGSSYPAGVPSESPMTWEAVVVDSTARSTGPLPQRTWVAST